MLWPLPNSSIACSTSTCADNTNMPTSGSSSRITRAASSPSVVDPVVVSELVAARRLNDPLAMLSARELDVLALMAEGRSNAGIAHRLWVTEGTVEKHVRSILTKLDLGETGDDHRRVLAVITFLESH